MNSESHSYVLGLSNFSLGSEGTMLGFMWEVSHFRKIMKRDHFVMLSTSQESFLTYNMNFQVKMDTPTIRLKEVLAC